MFQTSQKRVDNIQATLKASMTNIDLVLGLAEGEAM